MEERKAELLGVLQDAEKLLKKIEKKQIRKMN